MTSVKSFGKWFKEAGRSHAAAVLSWGCLFLYTMAMLVDISLDGGYRFFGIGSKELGGLSAGAGLAFSLLEFFYLFQEKKQDFYYSLPVKKSTVFWSRYVNGLIQFALPLFLSQSVCSVYMAAENQRFAGYAGDYLGRSVCAALLLFLMFYHIGILAAVVSGRALTAILTTVLILAYFQILIENVFLGFAEEIYRHYYRIPALEEALKLLAPLRNAGELLGTGIYDAQEAWEYVPEGPVVLGAFGWAALCLLLAALVHRQRRAELTGRAFTCARAERITEAAVSLLFGLWAGELLLKLTKLQDFGLWAAGVLLCAGAIAAACAVYVLLLCALRIPGERPGGRFHVLPKELFFRRGCWLASVCAGVGIIVGILLGSREAFDGYLPGRAQLESLSLSVDGIDIRQKQYAQSAKEDGYGTEERMLRYTLKEEESIGTGLAWIEETLEDERASGPEITEATVCYRLRDGSSRYRAYPLSKGALDSFSKVYETKEYKARAYPLIETEDIAKGQVIWSNGVTERAVRLSAPEKAGLLAAYRTDVKRMCMEQLKTAFPAGYLEIISEADGIHLKAMVYPFFGQTCEILRAAGVETEKTLADYKTASVKVQTSSKVPEGYTGGVSLHFYEEEEEVAEWTGKLIPEELAVQPLLHPADTSVWAEAVVEDEDAGASAVVRCYGLPASQR